MAVLGDLGILRGTLAARPTNNSPTRKGRLYLATDAGVVYRDSGSAWEPYAVLLVEHAIIPASPYHAEATVGALFDDLESRSYYLATTTTYPVTEDGADVTDDGVAVFERM